MSSAYFDGACIQLQNDISETAGLIALEALRHLLLITR